MPEKLEVYWTERSVRNAQQILDYLQSRFTHKEEKEFESSLKNFEKNVAIFPFLYPHSAKYPDLRKAVVHKFTSIFYKVTSDKIIVVAMQDNRQEKPS